MRPRDRYAQKMGYLDLASMAAQQRGKGDTQASAIEGLIIAHVVKALDAIEDMLHYDAEKSTGEK